MISLLGMACVVWTAFEILRLARRDTAPAFATMGPAGPTRDAEAASASPRARPRRRHVAAWDERGRAIEVEDLGHP